MYDATVPRHCARQASQAPPVRQVVVVGSGRIGHLTVFVINAQGASRTVVRTPQVRALRSNHDLDGRSLLATHWMPAVGPVGLRGASRIIAQADVDPVLVIVYISGGMPPLRRKRSITMRDVNQRPTAQPARPCNTTTEGV